MAPLKKLIIGSTTLLNLIFPYLCSHAQLSPKLIVTTRNQQSQPQSHIIMSAMKAARVSRKSEQVIWKKISEKTFRVDVDKSVSQDELADLVEELKHDAQIESVEIDIVMHAFTQPSDQRISEQWSLLNEDDGLNMLEAWEISQGDSGQTIAILDTGVLAHPDFAQKIVPGFDMISDASIANDGDGRDADATDAGDWVGPGDPCYGGFPQSSTWHGTHVAGIAAASGNNGLGIAGVSWHARILPVRVLGKCGGYSSDIADAVRWAAGGSVAGAGANPNPAKVINLSLGGRGSCSSFMQSAIDFALARGSVVVVAAGNENLNLDFNEVTPANCRGVITVGATQEFGARAGYSNFGQRIDVMAPGGGGGRSILSTYNSGSTRQSGFSYLGLNGTSMAAPHVAGVASLIFSVQPGLFPAQVKDIIKRSTRPLTQSWSCPVDGCGEGLLDAAMALNIALQTTPDSRFQGEEPLSPAPQNQADNMQTGGGCATIDIDPKGPKNGGPFIMSFFMMLLLMKTLVKTEQRR